MAKFLLLASLNCDRVLELDLTLRAGVRAEARSRGRRLGGAGANVGSALAAAGHQVDVACALGDDATGDWLCAEAARLGLGLEPVVRYRGATPEVWILSQPDGERTILFVDRREPCAPSPALAERPAEALFVNSASDAAAVLMRRCLDERLVVAQMPQRPRPWPAHVLLSSAADLDRATLRDPFAAGREIAGESLRHVVITHGAAGAVAHSADGRLSVPAFPVDRVVDATGAGDVFAAGLLDALVAGLPMGEALARGARWAALAVQSPVSVAPANLRQMLAAGESASWEAVSETPDRGSTAGG